MKLTSPLIALRNATSDMWRMHDFNYQLPKDQRQDYWKNECIDHPTSQHCKVYQKQYKLNILIKKRPLSGSFYMLQQTTDTCNS